MGWDGMGGVYLRFGLDDWCRLRAKGVEVVGRDML